MGSFGIWHWLILAVVVLVFFGGKGKISDMMGDFGKGVKSFRKGLNDDDEQRPSRIGGPSHEAQSGAGPTSQPASDQINQ